MLKSLPLFSLFSDDELAALTPSAERRRYLARSLILRAGEPAEGLFIIVTGRAAVLMDDGDAREFIVSVLGPEDFFGELGLLEGGVSTVSVASQEACEVIFVPRDRLIECLRRNAGAVMLMLGRVLARLTDAHHKIESLALMPVYGRVARVLLEQARDDAGEWRVSGGTEQIAAMVGASREMVSRVLKEMVGCGFVRRYRRSLIVTDRGALADRARLDDRPLPA